MQNYCTLPSVHLCALFCDPHSFFTLNYLVLQIVTTGYGITLSKVDALLERMFRREVASLSALQLRDHHGVVKLLGTGTVSK